MLFRKHEVKPSCFFLYVIAKHLYAILAPVKFQWVFNLPISKLAVDTKARGDMQINLFGVRCISFTFATMHWPENCFKVCVHREWNLELVLSILKLDE